MGRKKKVLKKNALNFLVIVLLFFSPLHSLVYELTAFFGLLKSRIPGLCSLTVARIFNSRKISLFFDFRLPKNLRLFGSLIE